MKTALTVLCATTMIVAGPAAAQGWDDDDMPHGKGHHRMGLMMMDADDDRAISREEFESHQADRFASADADGNGEVTMEEFSAFIEAEKKRRQEMRRAHMFERLDSNGDGVIDAEETAANNARMFDRMDGNGDGKLDAADRQKNKKGKGWRN